MTFRIILVTLLFFPPPNSLEMTHHTTTNTHAGAKPGIVGSIVNAGSSQSLDRIIELKD